MNIKESSRDRTRGVSARGGPGVERGGPGKSLVPVPTRVLPYAYLQTRALSRLGSLEEDDYLHRDTFSLSRLVYLLIYLPVLRVYTVSSLRVPPLLLPNEETLRDPAGPRCCS